MNMYMYIVCTLCCTCTCINSAIKHVHNVHVHVHVLQYYIIAYELMCQSLHALYELILQHFTTLDY